MTKANNWNHEPNSEKHELTIDVLDAVSGGEAVRDRRRSGLDNIQKLLFRKVARRG